MCGVENSVADVFWHIGLTFLVEARRRNLSGWDWVRLLITKRGLRVAVWPWITVVSLLVLGFVLVANRTGACVGPARYTIPSLIFHPVLATVNPRHPTRCGAVTFPSYPCRPIRGENTSWLATTQANRDQSSVELEHKQGNGQVVDKTFTEIERKLHKITVSNAVSVSSACCLPRRSAVGVHKWLLFFWGTVLVVVNCSFGLFCDTCMFAYGKEACHWPNWWSLHKHQ